MLHNPDNMSLSINFIRSIEQIHRQVHFGFSVEIHKFVILFQILRQCLLIFFRLVPCGLCDNAKTNLLDLPNHLTNFHSATKIVIPRFKTFNLLSMSYAYLKVNRRSQKVCEVEGTTFLINWTLEADDSTVATTRNRPTPAAIFWACLVGPKSESDDFKYSLQILSSRYLYKHYKLCSGLV